MEQEKSVWTRRFLRKPESGPEEPELLAAQIAAARPPAVVIEAGCALDGRLVTERMVRVEGDFRGSIESSDCVVVEESGSVVGDIRARSVTIHGAVVGNVSGTREVLLHPSGRLQGDVVTSSFALERGAYFNGHTEMLRPQAYSRQSADPQTPAPQERSRPAVAPSPPGPQL